MYVEKIEIPAFRVLRDVVLDFGGGYDPQIFPIGSENGGGKSTLLQLVFALLHCSAEPKRHEYLENLLASDFYTGNDEERLLARLTLRNGDSSHILEFISLHRSFLDRKLENPPQQGFETWAFLKLLTHSRERDESAVARHKQVIAQLATRPAEQKIQPQDLIRLANLDDLVWHHEGGQRLGELRQEYSSRLTSIQQRIEQASLLKQTAEFDIERIHEIFIARDVKLIIPHPCQGPQGWETRALVCRIQGQSAARAEELLQMAAQRVFLLGPSNQQYLFLGKSTRKALLAPTPPSADATDKKGSPPRPQIEYMTKLDQAERTMTGFFAYDWLSVEPLVQLFASARDEDFKNRIKTGAYGETYTKLMQEVNELLLGKKVRPLEDLSGIEFIVGPEGHETPLSPEDLSQGELKRLMIYAWLKANKAVDSLVLIDEIEASLHPDWQLGIVHDLQSWAPNNQYLLATHSYDLCQALTPRHVRELQPRLQWKGAPAAEGAAEPQDRNDE